GIYHFPLFCYLVESGFEVFVLNPLITDSNKNSGIRKVKTDKNDSLRIAKTGYTHDLKVSLIPSNLVINLRSLSREYYNLSDAKTAYVNKLHKELRMVFPSYSKVFSNLTGKTSILLLKTYKTPTAILNAPKDEIVSLIAINSRKGLKYANEKYNQLIKAAELSKYFGQHLESVFDLVQLNIEFIEIYNSKIENILTKIKDFTIKYEHENFIQQIHLLDSIKGIGFISAVALMCEIGDFSAFSKPKQLYAYFGLDPAVKESGKFKGTKTSMSKRGSRLARRVLFTIALVSVRGSRSGTPNNPVLHAYYENKKQSKPKMVALGAVMHKISNIIFAVLRDNAPFVMRTPEQHKMCHNTKLSIAA
ncbi:MAG: IS110 family transposase, partial [Desulfobacterales bacterium]|nr:IS110 family transposase [Desulfobacterales bacterium]